MIKAIIFDFDGVLYDSELNHFKACNTVFDSLGFTMSYEDYIGKYIGLSDKEMFPLVLSDYEKPYQEKDLLKLLADKISAYKKFFDACHNLPTIPGVAHFLKEVSQLISQFAICSGSSREELETALSLMEQGHLKKYFSVITTIEDVAEGKPSPEGYLKTAKKINIAPEHCLVIEDTPKGIAAAKNAHMLVAGLTTSFPATDLNQADYVADHYDDILTWLKKQRD